MRVAWAPRYGTGAVVEFRDLPDPVPGPGEVLVRVHAATVNRTDRETLRAHPWFARPLTGWIRPKHPVLGLDFAGVVEAVGAGVTRFQSGDRVFGMTPEGHGAHAELLVMPESGPIETIPEGLDSHQAVVCEGAWYGGSGLDKVALGPEQSILVFGASGAIGTAVLQMAKARGARAVAVVSARHVGLAHDLGADRVIDYQAEDFTACGEVFDVVFDAVGKTRFRVCRGLVKPGGAFAATDLGPWWQNVWLGMIPGATGGVKVTIPMPGDPAAAVARVRDLLAAGQLRAVIDRHYPFDRIADAYAHVASEKKTGIVVLDMPATTGA